MLKYVYEILRDLREDRDLKQKDIANLLGTTQQYYSKYETGKYDLPLRFLTALADFYGVSTDYLLGRTECCDGVEGANKTVVAGYSAGKLWSDVMTLNAEGRKAVVDYIALQKKAGEHQRQK